MLQFNLLRPEWTGIIKQSLSYDGESVSSVSVVIRLRTGRQENMARFSTKIILSLSHFLWANAVSCPTNTGSALPRGQAVRVCSLLSSGTDSLLFAGWRSGQGGWVIPSYRVVEMPAMSQLVSPQQLSLPLLINISERLELYLHFSNAISHILPGCW